MIEKNSLFYMANLSPEIGRMFRAFDAGKKEIANQARDRAIGIIDEILINKEVKPAGREEWFAVRNLIVGYNLLDAFTRKILESFGQPFSLKFMSQYNN